MWWMSTKRFPSSPPRRSRYSQIGSRRNQSSAPLDSTETSGLSDMFNPRIGSVAPNRRQGPNFKRLWAALFGLTVSAGGANLALLYVFASILGVGEATLDTTTQTLLPATVARSDLDQANGRLIATERICNELAGPPVGSVLFASFAAASFILDAASFVAEAALIGRATTRVAQPQRVPARDRRLPSVSS
jgi:MFS family permease